MRKIKVFFITLAALMCLLLSGLPALAQPETTFGEGAVADSKVQAATLLKDGQAAEAYELYMRLYRANPEDDEIVLGLARSAAAAGKHNQAIMAYERLINLYPGDAGLYGEIANSYMAINDRPTAEYYMARMNELSGGAASQEELFTALDKMERAYDRFQYRGRVRFGFLYDSNANQGPSTSTMDLGPWRNVIVPDVDSKETFGAYLGADIDMGWRLEPQGSWWLVGDMQAFLRGNTNSDLHDVRAQESQWGRAAVGLRHLSSETLLDFRFKAEVFDYEFYQHISAIGPEAVFLWAATPSVQLITRGGVDRRHYSQDPGRNGAYYWAGQYLRLFMGERNHEVMFGVRYTGGAADRNDYSYNGWEGSLGFNFKLPMELEFSPFISFAQEFYDGPATILEGSDREDDRWRAGAGLTYHITEDWDAELMYQYTNNDSNSPLYDYDQHLITTGLVWKF